MMDMQVIQQERCKTEEVKYLVEKGSAESVSKGTLSIPQNLSFDCVAQGSKI